MNKLRARRRVVVVDNRPLARAIGGRIRSARQQRGLSQRELAAGRYTPSYVSALENGLVKPSMAALSFLAERLHCSINDLIGNQLSDAHGVGMRLEADLRLASGEWQRALDLYREVLEQTSDDRDRAEAQRGAAQALYRLGQGTDAIALASLSRSIFNRLGRPVDVALADYWLASGHYQAGNSAEAGSILRGILERAHAGLELPPDFGGRVLIALAKAEIWGGDAKRAASYLEEARALAEEMDDVRRARFLLSLALSYRDSGDVEAAIRVGQRSMALFEAHDANREAAMLANTQAITYLRMGSVAKSRRYARQARQMAETLGEMALLAPITDTEAQIALARGDWQGAIGLASKSIGLATQDGNSHALIDAFRTRARAHATAGSQDEALADYEKAADAARTYGSRRQQRTVLTEWGDFVTETGNHAKAGTIFREALLLD